MYSCLKQTKNFFFFTKVESRRTEQVLPGEVVPAGEGRMWGKGVGE
jgi:hypothetical protein